LQEEMRARRGSTASIEAPSRQDMTWDQGGSRRQYLQQRRAHSNSCNRTGLNRGGQQQQRGPALVTSRRSHQDHFAATAAARLGPASTSSSSRCRGGGTPPPSGRANGRGAPPSWSIGGQHVKANLGFGLSLGGPSSIAQRLVHQQAVRRSPSAPPTPVRGGGGGGQLTPRSRSGSAPATPEPRGGRHPGPPHSASSSRSATPRHGGLSARERDLHELRELRGGGGGGGGEQLERPTLQAVAPAGLVVSELASATLIERLRSAREQLARFDEGSPATASLEPHSASSSPRQPRPGPVPQQQQQQQQEGCRRPGRGQQPFGAVATPPPASSRVVAWEDGCCDPGRDPSPGPSGASGDERSSCEPSPPPAAVGSPLDFRSPLLDRTADFGWQGGEGFEDGQLLRSPPQFRGPSPDQDQRGRGPRSEGHRNRAQNEVDELLHVLTGSP